MMKGKLKHAGKQRRPPHEDKNSRKVIRKQQRQLKKAKKHQFYATKKASKAVNKSETGRFVKRLHSAEVNEDTLPKKKQRRTSTQELAAKEREKELRDEKKLQKEMEEQRRKMLVVENEEEDRLIKKLEKQLGLSKVKNKKNLFADDGLDYLLEVCDRSTSEQLAAAQKHLADVNAESDFEDDLAAVKGRELQKDCEKEKKSSKKFKNVNTQMNESSDEGMDTFSEDKDTRSDNDKMNPVEEAFGSEGDSDEEISSQEETVIENKKKRAKSNDKRPTKGTEKKKSNKGSIVYSEDSDFSGSDPSDVLTDCDSDDENGNSDQEVDKKPEKPDVWEDIYGRKRDKEGNIIKEEKGAYIPPHLRNTESDSQIKEMIQLKRQIKGVLNKLAGTNLHWACTTVEGLYNNHSRHAVNTALTDLWTDALVQSALTPDRMLAEHAAFVSVLQANVGVEIGAHFLQVLVKKFDTATSQLLPVEGKQVENLTAALAFLYSFKIYEASLVYELLSRLLSHADGADCEQRVGCVLAALRVSGGALRKDKPLALKQFIHDTQDKLAKLSSEVAAGSRIKYLLEVLMAVKNNNLTKIPNYEPTYSEHLKKITKTIIRRGNYVTTLNIGLEDLLKADTRGKWWVVGSAWEGPGGAVKRPETETRLAAPAADTRLLELARKQRMNTDIRRNIFCIIMSAQDYMDAFEKLQHLGLKNQQEREIVHVLLACCLQERTYNPYYAVLANKLCDYDRKLQLAIQYSVWDKIKELDSTGKVQVSNLAQFLIHLIMEKGLPLSVLKVIEFSDLTKNTVRFMRQILLAIIMNENLQSSLEVFQRIAAAPKLHMFRESLRLFIQHFLIRNAGKKTSILGEDEMSQLRERTQQVDKILTMHDSRLRL